MVEHGRTLVFMGDSITDAGRDRADPASLGNGYVAHIAAVLAGPDRTGGPWRVVNRGINGNRAHDVAERWDRDCLAEHPDALSLLIGVNDTWRRFDSGDPRPISAYEAALGDVLDRTRTAGIDRIVLVEPFVLPVPPVTSAWDEELTARRRVVARLAADAGAVLVRAQEVFDQAARAAEPAALLSDGVHPTPAGHRLLAEAWLRAADTLTAQPERESEVG